MYAIRRNAFGAIPLLAIQFATFVGKLMINYQMTSAAAARQAAAEFDYLQAVSEAELTEIAFEMARQYPEFKYWQWFNLLKNLRKYGMMEKPPEMPEQPPSPPKPQGQALYWWIGAAVIAAFVLLRRN